MCMACRLKPHLIYLGMHCCFVQLVPTLANCHNRKHIQNNPVSHMLKRVVSRGSVISPSGKVAIATALGNLKI